MRCMLHVVNIETHTQPDPCIYLGAEFWVATYWLALSQTALGICHLFHYCEPLLCVKYQMVFPTSHVWTPFGEDLWMLEIRFLQQRWQTSYGHKAYLRGTDLSVRGFGDWMHPSASTIRHSLFSSGHHIAMEFSAVLKGRFWAVLPTEMKGG